MTKEQTVAIPEDLYNLTQLAEVTLAACKLSTTNISEIKDYINSSKRIEEEPQLLLKHPLLDEPHIEPAQTPQNMTATVTLIRAPANSSIPNMADIESEVKVDVSSPRFALTSASASTSNSTSGPGSSSGSSDEEIANYYSHKVFDRKKLRRSTISDQSRYDEHSCSSIPSCSGDEHSQALSQTRLAKTALNLLEDEHICPECGKKYSTSSNLARHRQTHRSIMDKKARRCPYCEKLYVSMPAFSMHVRTHSQGCKCQYCGKCFSRPWLLQGHIRTHTGEKPFKCGVCQKAFADKSNLRAHIQTHSNTKPHTCLRCGKSFALKSYLYKHEESSCMKNLGRGDKEQSRHHHHHHHLQQGQSLGPSPTQTDQPQQQQLQLQLKLATGANAAKGKRATSSVTRPGDSAKSTLATKLLQKKQHTSQLRRDFADRTPNVAPTATVTPTPTQARPYGLPYSLTSSLTAVNISAFNLQNIMASAEGHEVAGPPLLSHPPLGTEKSYTVLTNSMSQEEYERFNRMSVIQPTASQYESTPTSTPIPTPDPPNFHTQPMNSQQQEPLQQQPVCYSLEGSIALKPQDQPVDFSPKSTFAHSGKASAFELTSNYTIVA